MKCFTDKREYRAAVDYFTNNPSEIESAWWMPFHHEHGCLFYPAARSGKPVIGNPSNIGSLTSIRKFDNVIAATPELTTLIRSDMRIPLELKDLTISSLGVFAEWQEFIDKHLDNLNGSVV